MSAKHKEVFQGSADLLILENANYAANTENVYYATSTSRKEADIL